MSGALIEIYLLEGGNYMPFGQRTWPCVPRIGDLIVVDINGTLLDAIIDAVIWGTDEESRSRFKIELGSPPYVKVNLMATILNKKRGRMDLCDTEAYKKRRQR